MSRAHPNAKPITLGISSFVHMGKGQWTFALLRQNMSKVLQFGKETLDTTGAYGRLMLNMFAAFAEFERDLVKERQKEGIAKAKAEQKYKGRKPTARAKAGEAVDLFRQGKTVSEIAKAVGIGRGSVYRALEAVGLKESPSRSDSRLEAR
jgi:DNA invertase Pin-like site-specific DNA recombinase